MFHSKPAFVSAIILFALTLPLMALASSAANIFPGGYWGPLLSCGSASGTYCRSLCDLLQTGQNITSFLTTLLFFIGVPLFAMWGGFLILTGGGAPDKLKEGRSIITGAVVGALIALGAYLIIQTFFWAIGAQTSTTAEAGKIPWPEIQCTP